MTSAAATGTRPVVRLTHNESPWPPTPAVQAVLEQAGAEAHRYPTPADEHALLEALAGHHQVSTEQVVLGAGAAGLLELIAQVCTGASAEVVCPWRAWEAYPDIIRRAGAEFVPVALTGRDEVDLDAVAAAITSRTAVVLLTHPHNPTGQPLEREQWQRFLNRVPDEVLVVLDEAYAEFLSAEERALSADGIADIRIGAPNLVVLRTFSKAHGLASLRVGYAITSSARAADLRRAQLPFTVNRSGLLAAHAALSEHGSRTARLCALRSERERVARGLAALGWPPVPSAANMLWLPLRQESEEFAAGLLEHGVVVKCWAGEGIRITVGTRGEGDVLLEAARALAD